MLRKEAEPLRIAKMRARVRPGFPLSAQKKATLRAEIAAWERENEQYYRG